MISDMSQCNRGERGKNNVNIMQERRWLKEIYLYVCLIMITYIILWLLVLSTTLHICFFSHGTYLFSTSTESVLQES